MDKLEAFTKELTNQLLKAFLCADEEEVRRLLKIGVDIKPCLANKDLLSSAAYLSNESLVKLLLEHGADVNARTVHGSTALHFAREEKIIQLLLDKGADINARGDKGMTPLHFAVKDNLLPKVRLLFD